MITRLIPRKSVAAPPSRGSATCSHTFRVSSPPPRPRSALLRHQAERTKQPVGTIRVFVAVLKSMDRRERFPLALRYALRESASNPVPFQHGLCGTGLENLVKRVIESHSLPPSP